MPTTKQELEIYHADYINSVKRNLAKIGENLKVPTKKSFFTPESVEKLASHGIGAKAIASIFGEISTAVTQDPKMMAAYEKGRSNIGSIIRASIIDEALNKDSLTAKLHLDKVFNKDDHSQDINLSVTQSPLEKVSDAALLEINLDESTPE